MVTAMRNHLAPDLGRNARRLADERIRVLDLHQFTADGSVWQLQPEEFTP